MDQISKLEYNDRKSHLDSLNIAIAAYCDSPSKVNTISFVDDNLISRKELTELMIGYVYQLHDRYTAKYDVSLNEFISLMKESDITSRIPIWDIEKLATICYQELLEIMDTRTKKVKQIKDFLHQPAFSYVPNTINDLRKLCDMIKESGIITGIGVDDPLCVALDDKLGFIKITLRDNYIYTYPDIASRIPLNNTLVIYTYKVDLSQCICNTTEETKLLVLKGLANQIVDAFKSIII